MTAEPEADVRHRAVGADHHGHLWTSSGMTSRTASPADIERRLTADDAAMAWFFLPREETAELGAAAAELGIDALAIEDLLGEREPIKLDWIGDSMVAVTRALTFDPGTGELTLRPVSLLAGPRAVIVLADLAVRDDICRHLDRAERSVLADGIPAVLHSALDFIIDGYTAVLQQMEDKIDELSELLFGDRALSRDQQVYAFTLRRSVARLRRATEPMRDIASGLANAAGRAADGSGGRTPGRKPTDPAEKLLGTTSVREFSDVADHADHVARGADGLRDVISSMYETNLALADVHLNMVMKKLTGWAAIIAVPTLITGFMGMNVPYPGFQSREGFLVAFAVMIAAVTTLFITLRRKDWI
jgi:magnesium transporter